MGLFSKKDKNDKRRTSDDATGDASSDSVDLDGRLGLPEDVAMNSLDYLDDTGDLLARSAPTVASQDGSSAGGWHMPDVEGASPEADLGSEESFTTFFGDDPEAQSNLESIVPDSYQVDPVYPESAVSFEAPPAGEIPASAEATEHFADHDRRLDDLPPMAAAGTSELAARSDFLAVDIDDLGQPADEFPPPPPAAEMTPVADPFAPPPGVTAPLLGQSSAPAWQPEAEAQQFSDEQFSDEQFSDEPAFEYSVPEDTDSHEPFVEEPVAEEPIAEEFGFQDSFSEDPVSPTLAEDELADEWVGLDTPEAEEVDMAALALASSNRQAPMAPPELDDEPATEPILETPQPVLETSPVGIDVYHDGPTGFRAETLLEILGLDTTATWDQIGETHRELSVELHDTIDGDPSREAVSRAIQREMNTAYAALRLMAVG